MSHPAGSLGILQQSKKGPGTPSQFPEGLGGSLREGRRHNPFPPFADGTDGQGRRSRSSLLQGGPEGVAGRKAADWGGSRGSPLPHCLVLGSPEPDP